MSLAGAVLLGFGLVSSLVLMVVGVQRAIARRYVDRTGAVREGGAAIRAGLLVAVIGAGELAVTIVLYVAAR